MGNYAYFESTTGDYVGLGKTYLFDQRSGFVEALSSGNDVYITVTGDDVWKAELRGVSAGGRLVPGYYPGVKGARFSNPTKGGLSWTGAGRGCSKSTSWFVVDAIAYDRNDNLTLFDLRFEQHCEGRDAPLRGVIHYIRAPVASITPANSSVGSWRAPAALLPSSDNFLYVQSDANEPLGKGITDLQTSKNAAIEVSTNGNSVQMYGKGNHTWGVQFLAPDRFAQVVAGSFDGVTTPPGDSTSLGALYVSADSTACNTKKGWVVVDSASYVAGKLVAIELRFEQLCDYGAPQLGLLHGHLRWRADVSNAFPGPVTPPSTFWRPTPALPTGNYIYMTSDPTDFIGNGEALFTPIDSVIGISEKDGKVDITVRGDTHWIATFATMQTAGKVLPGYYAGLRNVLRPARGEFTWGGDGRGCNESSTGVVVDSAAYQNGKLSELQLRFEQHCENGPGALRGEVHWFASDTRQPFGPRASEPTSLWHAPAGALPSSGNYLYVQSEPGEVIGGGKTYTLTPKNATMKFYSATNYRNFSGGYFSLNADSGTWDGGRFWLEFQTMSVASQLQVGFYDRTMRYMFHNTAFGGLSLTSHNGACNTSMGWMALDKVTYLNGNLSAIHGRFQHHCEEYSSVVYGEFNWEG
ncbi:MAG: hypothetical protein Q7T25_03520 [Sideroxyarcus sp.]|nr:hypothetical protein [Sideroxyarcus sp.]